MEVLAKDCFGYVQETEGRLQRAWPGTGGGIIKCVFHKNEQGHRK